jgi:hypothetical protein
VAVIEDSPETMTAPKPLAPPEFLGGECAPDRQLDRLVPMKVRDARGVPDWIMVRVCRPEPAGRD